MSFKFISKRRFVLDFEDENGKNKEADNPIACKIHRIRIKDMFEVQNEILEATGLEPDQLDSYKVNTDNVKEVQKFWSLIEFVIGKFTSEWEGVSNDGKIVTDSVEVVELVGMENMEQLSPIFFEILSGGRVTEEDAKNSEPDSDAGNLESGIIAPNATMNSEKSETVGENSQETSAA